MKDRFTMVAKYVFLGLILWCLQALGLEYLNNEILNKFFQNVGFSNNIIRFGIYLIVALIPNALLFTSIFLFVSKQQKESIRAMNKFLKMTIEERLYSWFYIIQFTLWILTGKERMFVWTTPSQYMKMHVATSILARRYYYSFYKAPDVIWKILRNHGGTEYCNEVRNINLKRGERYVVQEANNMFAYNDFQNICNLEIYYVKKDKIENIPDFSSFDAGEKFINLRIFDGDEKRVERFFEKFATDDLSKPERTRKKLNKVRFRVHIEISDSIEREGTDIKIPTTNWVQNTLQQLKP